MGERRIIIDQWIICFDRDKNIESIDIINPTLRLSAIRLKSDQIPRKIVTIRDLDAFMFTPVANVDRSKKPIIKGTFKYGIQDIDISIEMDDCKDLQHYIEISDISYDDGILYQPRAHEMFVRRKRDGAVRRHLLIWELDAHSHILFNGVDNYGHIYDRKDYNKGFRKFDLISKFSIQLYGKTKNYNFVNSPNVVQEYPILFTSEGILCSNDHYKLYREYKKGDNVTIVTNFME